MDADGELLAKIQSPDLHHIHRLIASYLHPFQTLIPPNPNPKNPTHSETRTLAKRYLSFLSKALSLIPARLSETPKIDSQFGTNLFESYKLCLQCLECISSQLLGKPYIVQSHRARLVQCYEYWGLYTEAQSEGFSVLEGLRGVKNGTNKKFGFVPGLGKGDVDFDFAYLVVDIVVRIVKCMYMVERKEESDYRSMLVLVDEVSPWFRVLDASAYEKLHRVLVTYLSKYSLLLVGKLKSSNKDLVHDFLLTTFAEYRRSSIKDQLHKFAGRVCSLLFSLQNDQSSSIMDIISYVLDSVAVECKVDYESTTIELLELVSYCANKCRIATKHLSSDLATYTQKLAGDLSQVDLILRLYSIGLFLNDGSGKPGHNNRTSTTKSDLNSGSVVGYFVDKDEVFRDLSVLLGRSKFPFTIINANDGLPTNCNSSVDSVDRMCSGKLNYAACGICKMKNWNRFLLPFYNAMKFVCQPLAEVVNSARNEIFAQAEACPPTILCTIRDVFLQFCDVFLVCYSKLERKSIGFDESDRTMLGVAVAALALSFRTNSYVKESVKFIKQVISADWVDDYALKFLCACINNIGVTLVRGNQVKEASVAIKLCWRAAWTSVSHLCRPFLDQSFKSFNDVLEDDANFVNDAFAKTAFLLDLLYQCNDHNKAIEVIRSTLEKWSAASDVFKRLPIPLALVKQWVKIECKVYKGLETECGAVSLYSLLSSSRSVSRISIGVILEQELSSYNEVRALNPKLSHKMQMDIIDVLLTEVYVTDDNRLQRSKVLITKGQELRASGCEGLSACIQCLSEAISLLLLEKNGIKEETTLQPTAIIHQLAAAHALRALCIQEAEPNSKSYFQDIHAAVKIWLSPECLADDQCDLAYENLLIILYHVVDVLSLKGYTEFHPDIYELLIRLFARMKIPLVKCLALLWQCRRFSHALCPSPLNEASVLILSQHCGEPSQFIEFWKNCLSGSLPLEIGFWQCFSFMFNSTSCGASHLGGSYMKIKVDDVKQAASSLTSPVPLFSDSAFLAAHLYYDLCERMISHGRLSEALSFAKEAYHLRCKLLQEKFRYSTNQRNGISDEAGGTVQKCRYTFSYFQVHSSVATAVWPRNKNLFNFEGTVLTPWNVLQCYLESTLQVGIVHELMGDGPEAESLLLWGKSISALQGLSLFELVFSTFLGRVYRKQKLWEQAEKELQSAELLFKNCCSVISCSKCRLLMEVTIILELGDLFRSRGDSYTDNIYVKRLSHAETLYKSAIDKLNHSEWKNLVSNPEELKNENAKTVQNQADVPETKAKRSRTTKNSAKQGQCLTAMPNHRMTRSKYRDQTNKKNAPREELQERLDEHEDKRKHLAFADTIEQRGPTLGINSSSMDFRTETLCFCNKKKCWDCLLVEVMHSGSVNNFVLVKWEFARRQLSLKLLAGLGKCMDACERIHESHEQLVQSISVLVGRNSFSAPSSEHLNFLLDLIGKDIHEDAFAIEHAALLYNICWVTLKSYPCKGPRISCCEMANIHIPKIVSWLMLAYLLCREVPVLVQKVSRLLGVVFVLFSSTELFSQPGVLCKTLSKSHWASYFHQASIGTHVNHRVISSMIGKENVLDSSRVEDCGLTNSRLVPETLQDLEEHVLRFFDGFPGATIIGISLLGGPLASLLSKILEYPYSARAWLLLSRLNSDYQPVVLLLPLDSILEEASDDTNPGSGILFEDKEVAKCWHSPWGSNVVDDVAPVFRQILEKSYYSSLMRPQDTQQNRSLWWKQRKCLDQQLGNFTRDLEELWLGPWKYVLLGEWSGSDNQESSIKKLVRELKTKCKVNAPESLLRVILGGSKLACLREEYVLQLILNGGCLVDQMNNQKSCKALADKGDGIEYLSERVLKLLLEATIEAEEDDLNRTPVILVLDYDIQMLPWESLPVLRNQEVYRMPSIGSIFATLDRCHQCHRQVGKEQIALPMIDPLDAFYLLNPSGDLIHSQAEFEDWFRNQNWEGKAGISPTVDELVLALSSHDLYIYVGHGSGAQYIPGHEIQKLENCAATLLLGCSSGSLSLNGCYAPKGTPLSYLLAGSPVIIANLWDVTDKDIDRFGKAMLDNWLRERSAASSDCVQCTNLIAKKFSSMQIAGTKGNTKKKTSKKNSPKDFDRGAPNDCCNHRPKVGSFVGQARDACTLPFLIGAAPVCYGVPTRISKKKV